MKLAYSFTFWDVLTSFYKLEDWLTYFVSTVIFLVILRFTRRGRADESFGPDDENDSNREECSYALDPLSLTFEDEKTQIAYARYTRETVSPTVNKFLALAMMFIGVFKFTRVIDSAQVGDSNMFERMPIQLILKRLSTTTHISLFFLALILIETDLL